MKREYKNSEYIDKSIHEDVVSSAEKNFFKEKDLSLEIERVLFYNSNFNDMFNELDEVKNPIYMRQFVDGCYKNIITETYMFSNERLRTLFGEYLNVKGKSALVVGSSGDQALYSIYSGAKRVVLVDANIFTQAYVEFKMAAIKSLSYKDFIDTFWKYDGRFEINPQIYAKLSHNLSSKVQNFWDTMIIEGMEDKFPIFANINWYNSEWACDEDNFYKLKHILNNNKYSLEFVYDDIRNYPRMSDEKFDLILLSNIYTYENEYMGSLIDELYEEHLNKGGAMQTFSWLEVQKRFGKEKFEALDYLTHNMKYNNCLDAHILRWTGISGDSASVFVTKSPERKNKEKVLIKEDILVKNRNRLFQL